jgi:hypothetical protein
VIDPLSPSPGCIEDEGVSGVWMLIFGGDADETISHYDTVEVAYDTVSPPSPIDVEAGYGEGNVTVSWKAAGDNTEDRAHFVVLCHSSDSEIPPEDAGSDADAHDIIEEDWVEDVSGEEASSGENCPPGGFFEGEEFDPTDSLDLGYVCSEFLGSTTRKTSISGLRNGVRYKFAVVAFDEFRNPSPVSAVACAVPEEVDDFWEDYKKSGGSGEGKFCFIATAAYGSPLHDDVKHLKDFRDEVLMKIPGGKSLVEQYYRRSPPAARAVESSSLLRGLVRGALVPAVLLARASLGLKSRPELVLVVMGLFLAAGGVAARRRRKRG